MTTYFGFAIADGMFPASTRVSRQPLEPHNVAALLQYRDIVSCCNPQHKATVDAAKARYGLDIPVPEKAPLVSLHPGDRVIVMSVRGLPRLEENRHEYTQEEIARATFTFGLWTVEA
ncbi:MAG: hypothetical protein WCI89_00925 [bacterium]